MLVNLLLKFSFSLCDDGYINLIITSSHTNLRFLIWHTLLEAVIILPLKLKLPVSGAISIRWTTKNQKVKGEVGRDCFF